MKISGQNIIVLTGQDFIKEYPKLRQFFPALYAILKKDPKYQVRIAVKDGEIADFEFGYPDDNWHIKMPENA